MELRYAINKESLTSLGTLTQQFKILYESEFPDIHEREDFDVILKRITDLVSEREPNSFIVLAVEQNDLLLGGLIGDWYSNCNSIHLTYIAVEKSARRNKVASTLIEKGIDIIKDTLSSKHDLKINQVLFEANIPNKTFEDSFDPVVRLEFFRKLRAKWIDIPYTQPALDKTKKSVKNLYLLVFPDIAQGNSRIKKSDLQIFLKKLYLGLGIENPSEDIDFIAMLSKINNTKELREMNLKEIPRPESRDINLGKLQLLFIFLKKFALLMKDQVVTMTYTSTPLKPIY